MTDGPTPPETGPPETGPPETKSRRPRAPIAATLFWRLMFGAAVSAVVAFVYIDENAPFDPSAQPHLFTSLQIRLMRVLPDRCPAALARARDVSFTPAPKPMENGCGHPDGVLLTRSQVSYGESLLLRCPAAVALVMWERHALQPEAEKAFGRRVSSVQTFGTYSCRNIYHRENARRSQHATANAIDVAGFSLEGGQYVSVLRDWKDEGTRGQFVRAVRDRACRFFGSVLSPDYNAAHADHLHLDGLSWTVCR